MVSTLSKKSKKCRHLEHFLLLALSLLERLARHSLVVDSGKLGQTLLLFLVVCRVVQGVQLITQVVLDDARLPLQGLGVECEP